MSGSIYSILKLLLAPTLVPVVRKQYQSFRKTVPFLKLNSQLSIRYIFDTFMITMAVLYFGPNLWTFVRRWKYSSVIIIILIIAIIMIVRAVPSFATVSKPTLEEIENINNFGGNAFGDIFKPKPTTEPPTKS